MDLSGLTKSLNDAADVISKTSDVSEADRRALLDASDRLRHSLETPFDLTLRLFFGTQDYAVLRIAVEMGLIDALANAKGKGVTISQLAQETNGDPRLIKRLTRLLAATHVLEETDLDTYASTPKAAACVKGSPMAAFLTHGSAPCKGMADLPDYFRSTKYKDPSDAFSGPIQYTLNTKLHLFEWFETIPEQQSAFNTVMKLSGGIIGEDWFHYFPVEEKLGRLSSPDLPLLIDIGGGVGHDVLAFHNHYPNLPGKLILEDLPHVISSAQLPPTISPIAHDFLKQPQPIHSARAYYMRRVLHDWPDLQARQILLSIRAAMDPENSLLLLNEMVLPARNVPLGQVRSDLHMMVCVGAMERTESDWTALLEGAGFEVKKVWNPDVVVPGQRSLIEAMVKK